MFNWKYIIAGFCIPINIFFIAFGIFIDDAFAIFLGISSIVLVSLPIMRDYNVERKENEKENPNDKGSSP